MKKISLVFAILIFVNGSLFSQLPKKPTMDEIRAYNQTNLLKVNIGDNRLQVIEAMGGIKTYNYYVYDWYNPGFNKNKRTGSISNPYSLDLKMGRDSSSIEIL